MAQLYFGGTVFRSFKLKYISNHKVKALRLMLWFNLISSVVKNKQVKRCSINVDFYALFYSLIEC